MTEPYQLTIAEAAAEIRRGSLSPIELTKSLLARSREVDPRLDVWVTLNEDAALDAAARSTEALVQGPPSSPLHGIPFGVKDIFYTKGVETTGGSKVYAGFVPQYDATCVTLLKRARGVMLGKTVTTEFAMFEPPPTKNPWNAERTPGGSSSGSAAGTAARMFPMALGSQTAGSVLRPAAYNGVVGVKPTFGLISRYGVMPVAWSLDTMGYFTRTVEDAEIVLDALAWHDPNDDVSLAPSATGYSKSPKPTSRPRIGFIRQYFSNASTSEVRHHTNSVLARFAAEGADVEEARIPIIDMEAAREAHVIVQSAEAAHVHDRDFTARREDYMPSTRSVIMRGRGISSFEYISAQELRRDLRRELLKIVEQFDVVVTPSAPAPAPDTTTTGDPACQWPWTTAGFPTISIPSGLSVDGMPLGVQLAAAPLNEATMFSVARWCETVLDTNLVPPV